MLTKVQKWGNSQGIRIPKKLLENSNIEVGEEVDLKVHEGKIVVEPTKNIHGKYRIKDLVARMPKNYKPSEEDWGPPAGREVW